MLGCTEVHGGVSGDEKALKRDRRGVSYIVSRASALLTESGIWKYQGSCDRRLRVWLSCLV